MAVVLGNSLPSDKMTIFTSVTAWIHHSILDVVPGNKDTFLDNLRKESGAAVTFRLQDNTHCVEGKWEAVVQIRNLLELHTCQHTVQRVAEAASSRDVKEKQLSMRDVDEHGTEPVLTRKLSFKTTFDTIKTCENDIAYSRQDSRNIPAEAHNSSLAEINSTNNDAVACDKPSVPDAVKDNQKETETSNKKDGELDPWPINFRPKKLQPMHLAVESLLKSRMSMKSSLVNQGAGPSSGVTALSQKPKILHLLEKTLPDKGSENDHQPSVTGKPFVGDQLPIKARDMMDLAERVKNASLKRMNRRRHQLNSSDTQSTPGESDNVSIKSDASSSWSVSSPAPASNTKDTQKYSADKTISGPNLSVITPEFAELIQHDVQCIKNNVGLLSGSPPPGPKFLANDVQVVQVSNFTPANISIAIPSTSDSKSDWQASPGSYGDDACSPAKEPRYSEDSSDISREKALQDAPLISLWDTTGQYSSLPADTNRLVNIGVSTYINSDVNPALSKSFGVAASSAQGSVPAWMPHSVSNPDKLDKDTEGNASASLSNRSTSYSPGSTAFGISPPEKFSFSNETNLIDLCGTFKCDKCCFQTSESYYLKFHIMQCHSDCQHVCNICFKKFAHADDLRQHMKKHDDSCIHSCHVPSCSAMFDTEVALKHHISEHDIAAVSAEINAMSKEFRRSHVDDKNTSKAGRENMFVCDECDKSFSSKYMLLSHVKKEHRGIVSGYKCSLCDKVFSQKHSLVEHQNVHSGNRPFRCTTCDKTFSFKTSLRQHMLLHNEGKNFHCDVCGKGFMQKNSLRIHSVIHKNERNHVCSYCGKGFTQKQAMQRHERIHSGERPYSCKVCSKNFNDSSILRRHMNIHQRGEIKDEIVS